MSPNAWHAPLDGLRPQMPNENVHDDPLSVSRLPASEDLQFSASAPAIEGYQILEMPGAAGQGRVWRAVQLSIQRQVALKVPRVGLLSSKSRRRRLPLVPSGGWNSMWARGTESAS